METVQYNTQLLLCFDSEKSEQLMRKEEHIRTKAKLEEGPFGAERTKPNGIEASFRFTNNDDALSMTLRS